MNNKGKASGFGIYAVAVVIIAVLYLLMSRFGSQTSDYTYDAFVKDVDSGSVTSVVIKQNAEVPTGVMYHFQAAKNKKCLMCLMSMIYRACSQRKIFLMI